MTDPHSPLLAASLVTLKDGSRLRLARLGSGAPLVLLHGYPDNLQLWSALAARLAPRFDVVAFDWPGMGDSDPWPGGATPWHMAEHLAAILDALDVPSAHVAGFDVGGQPALVLAALRPERVRKLVIMNSLVDPEAHTSWEIRLLRRFSWNRILLRRFPRLVFARALSTSLAPGERLPRELRSELWRTFRRPEVRAFIAKLCAGYQGTLRRLPALYPSIRSPTLALWGERDRHFPPVHAARVVEAVPGARSHRISGGEHWMAWSRSGEVADALLAFLAEA